jgi:hypothetical protein
MRNILIVALLASAGCAHLITTTQLLNCGESAVESQLPSLGAQVEAILSAGQVNQQEALNTLLATAGNAVICAVQAEIAKLASSSAPAQERAASLVTLQAFLKANHVAAP